MANVRCFTLRLPPELYVQLFDAATVKDKTLNAMAIELIQLGMAKQLDVREALKNFLNKEFGPDGISPKS